MPDRPQPALAEQLRAALSSTGVSQRALAARLALADGSDPEDKRRWVRKVLAGDVQRPEPSSLRAIEVALQLEPGHLKPPTRVAAAEARRSVELRLEDLEEQTRRRAKIANDALAATAALERHLKQLQGEVRKLARQVSEGQEAQTVEQTRSARATRAKRPQEPA